MSRAGGITGSEPRGGGSGIPASAVQAAAQVALKVRMAAYVARHRVELLRRSGVGQRVIDILAGQPVQTCAMSEVDRWFPSPETFLALATPPGVGKSVAEGHAIKIAIDAHPDENMLTWSEPYAPRMVTAAWIQSMSLYDADVWRAVECPCLLAIDDLGTEVIEAGGHFLAKLERLIDFRYRENRKTIIATNLDAATFAARFGQRIADRLSHPGVARFVEWAEPTRRK